MDWLSHALLSGDMPVLNLFRCQIEESRSSEPPTWRVRDLSLRRMLLSLWRYYEHVAVHPAHPWKVLWDWFVVILVVFSAVVVPLEISFQPPWTSSSAFITVDQIINTVFWLDLCINMCTGWVDKWGTLITDKRCDLADARRFQGRDGVNRHVRVHSQQDCHKVC